MPWLNHDGLIILYHSDAEEEPRGLLSTERSWSRKWSSIVTHLVFFYNLLLFDVAFGKPLTLVAAIRRLDFAMTRPRLFMFLFVSKLRILRQLSGFLCQASLLLQGSGGKIRGRCAFPTLICPTKLPSLRLTGGPVMLVMDDSS